MYTLCDALKEKQLANDVLDAKIDARVAKLEEPASGGLFTS